MKSEWAGIPMPMADSRLIVEPRYPYADLAKIHDKAGEESDEAAAAREGWKVRSRFWSSHMRCEIIIFQEADGSIRKGALPGVHSLRQQLATLGAADAWGLDQEAKALDLLASLVSARQLRQYILTGSFLERSKRTGLTYLFRRLRPTVVIDADPERDTTSIRCALCLHPIAYYEGSWGGAMCPTDDVVAHLMLMRGDEPLYWRRANQHPAYRPEAGL